MVIAVVVISTVIAGMVIRLIITSVVTLFSASVRGSLVMGLVDLAVVGAVVLTLTVVVLSGGNSDNSSECKRSHDFVRAFKGKIDFIIII